MVKASKPHVRMLRALFQLPESAAWFTGLERLVQQKSSPITQERLLLDLILAFSMPGISVVDLRMLWTYNRLVDNALELLSQMDEGVAMVQSWENGHLSRLLPSCPPPPP